MLIHKKALPLRSALFLTACAVMTLTAPGAFAQVERAQSIANPARIGEQLEDETLVPDAKPPVDVQDPILQQVPPGAENIKFVLNAVQPEGVTVYSESDLRGLYADKMGQTISLADVYAIATAMTNKYRNEGYILSQVIVPPQTIDGGTVRLQVIEGYIDRVLVEGPAEDQRGLGLIRDYATHIRTGAALNIRDLERYLLLINDLPGVEARSVLSPSENQTGAADLRIIITRDPFDGLLAVDNFGSRYLGPLQLTGVSSFNSFFGLNERITAQVVMAPDWRDNGTELAYMAFAYEQPIFSEGTTLEIAGNHTNTDPGYDLTLFNVRGRNDFVSVRVSHPFIRSRAENLKAYALFDWRDVVTKNIIDRREDRIRAVRAGAVYQFLDTLFGAGANAVTLEVAKGVDVLESSNHGDSNLSRSLGDPHFVKGTLDAQRLQRITSNLNLLLAARGQLSSDPLLSSEEFGVGGPTLGRAYDPSEIIGDEGMAGKLELQWNRPYPVNFVENYQLFGFYDAGTVWNDDATTSDGKRDSIVSAGFGVRSDITETIEGGAAVAFPISREVQTRDNRDPRFYLNLSKKF